MTEFCEESVFLRLNFINTTIFPNFPVHKSQYILFPNIVLMSSLKNEFGELSFYARTITFQNATRMTTKQFLNKNEKYKSRKHCKGLNFNIE